ncbi:hypothetical protein PCE1_001180 [Barthelona sp. PCE]
MSLGQFVYEDEDDLSELELELEDLSKEIGSESHVVLADVSILERVSEVNMSEVSELNQQISHLKKINTDLLRQRNRLINSNSTLISTMRKYKKRSNTKKPKTRKRRIVSKPKTESAAIKMTVDEYSRILFDSIDTCSNLNFFLRHIDKEVIRSHPKR